MGLTEMQARCLDLRIKGFFSKEIAVALHIAMPAVHKHFANALERAGCRTSYQLAAEYAAGMVKIEPLKEWNDHN